MGILPIYLGKDELRLDMSDPYDYIKIKVLMACPIVANSLDEIKHMQPEPNKPIPMRKAGSLANRDQGGREAGFC